MSSSSSSSITQEAKKTGNNVLNGVKGVAESRSAMGVAPLTPVFGVKDCEYRKRGNSVWLAVGKHWVLYVGRELIIGFLFLFILRILRY